MILSNVNVGTGPSAGDGDTLRSAFSTINNNFQIVTNNVHSLTNSVTSVAGRTGNIILTASDVIGVASIAYVNTLAGNNRVISVAGRTGNVVLDVADVANAASTSYVAGATANVTSLHNDVYTITLDSTGHLVLNTDFTVFGAPGVGGINDKIRLYDFSNVSVTNFAIGLENDYLWNSADAGSGFKWYSGETEVFKILSSGNLQLSEGASILNSLGNRALGNFFFNDNSISTETGNMTFATTGGSPSRIDFETDQFGVDIIGNINLYAGDTATVIAGNVTTPQQWAFNPDGSMSFPDSGTLRVGNPPPSSMGETGNMPGEIAFDNNYIYYCTGPYDGSTDIWRRVALDQNPFV
jgi:hypothetical protein